MPSHVTSRSLRRNLSSTLLGNIVFAACQFCALTAVVRCGSVEDVGRYALALAISSPAFALASLKLRHVQATDATDQYEFGHYLALRLAATGLAAAGVLSVTVLLPFTAAKASVIAAATLLKTFESMIDVFHGALQRHQQMQLVARSMIVRGTAGLVVFALMLQLTHRVDLAVVGQALVTAYYTIVIACRVRAMGIRIRPRFQRAVVWRLTRLAVPLGGGMCLASLVVHTPRYVLELFHGAAQVGVYSALVYLATIGNTVISAMALTTSPRLAIYHATGRAVEFRRLLWRSVGLGAFLGAAGVVASLVLGRWFLYVMYGAQYARHSDALVVVAVAAAISYAGLFVGTALDAIRVFHVQLPLQLATLIVVALASIMLVPWGLFGAALAMLTGTAVNGALRVVLYRRLVRRERRRGARPRHRRQRSRFRYRQSHCGEARRSAVVD